MGFYTQADVENGTFKKKKAKSVMSVGAGQNDTYNEVVLETPVITKKKTLKKLNEIAEPSTVKEKLKVFIDFKFK
jgi:hypothetical protein